MPVLKSNILVGILMLCIFGVATRKHYTELGKKHSSRGLPRNIVQEHITTHKKQTSSDGTITKDKTTEGTKLKDDNGNIVNKNNAGEAKKVSYTTSPTNNEESDPKIGEHKKILDDILSGKHENDYNAVPEAPIETDSNRTIPIDKSILTQGTQLEHDPNNPDADVGMMGMDPSPAIEPEEEKARDDNKVNTLKVEGKGKEPNKDGGGRVGTNTTKNIKTKGDKIYWLGGEDEKTKDSGNTSTTKKETKKLIRILCFGDSITKGYVDHGRKYHPYSIKLEALLREDNLKVDVLNHGINGECVSLEMEERLARDLKELPKLDLVIILGGTNDLLSLDCVRKLDLFQEIKNLHKMVKDKGYKSVIVTIPESKLGKRGTDEMTLQEYMRELDDTNQKLRMYAVSSKLPLIDLADDFSRHSMPGVTNVSAMWDDDIHPSREGYDRIGEIIYKQVKGLLPEK